MRDFFGTSESCKMGMGKDVALNLVGGNPHLTEKRKLSSWKCSGSHILNLDEGGVPDCKAASPRFISLL